MMEKNERPPKDAKSSAENPAEDSVRRVPVLKLRTHDEVRRAMEWDGVRMIKLGGGEWDVESLIASDGPWMLDYIRTGHDLQVKGERPHGDYALLMGGTYELPFHHKGVILRPGRQIMLRGPDFVADDFLPAGMNGIGLRIRADYFLKHVEPMLPADSADRWTASGTVSDISENIAADISEWFEDALGELRNEGFTPESLRRCCERMLDLYCEWAYSSETGSERMIGEVANHHVVRKLEEYFSRNAHEPPSLDQLCKIAGCSPRALYNVISGHFGKSPCQYMQLLRLNGVHRELRDREPRPGLVAELACKWGFWQFGRFARDYKKLFGELPKETLSRPGRES